MPSLRSIRLSGELHPGVPVLLGMWAAAVALVPHPATKLMLVAPFFAAGVFWWSILRAGRWMALFFFAALLLPPLPASVGNAGISIAPLALIPGVAIGLLRLPEWRAWRSQLPLWFGVFLCVLAMSPAFAALYSGWTVAAGSLARVLLFGISAYIFLYTFAGPRETNSNPLRFAGFLFIAGAAGALFACVDFYFQIPAPGGYGAQFIWVGQDIFRRAQGLFYEASTLGNFCAFFLVMILTAFPRPPEERPCSRAIMALGAIPFAGALIFSYSRASLAALAVAICAWSYVQRLRVRRRSLLTLCLAIAGAWVLVRVASPALSSHYWTRLEISFQYLWETPDRILSGRLSTWGSIAQFLAHHPLDAIFGIGYKTLPYTGYIPGGLIVDNTYLSLLAETGIIGLAAFGLLNAAILRTSLRAARSAHGHASFFGCWIFSFWCGEMAQMLSGDLITFWRVLPVYFWVLATAAREAGE